MTKADQTRQYIIEKTAPLFNRKGFDGTSLSDLTTVTGLTKGALYGNFEDKDEIAREAFQFAMAKVKRLARQRVGEKTTFREKLSALLGFYAQYVKNPPVPGGCPMLNTAVEADDHRVSMRKVVARELEDTITFIAGLIRGGMAAGEFRKDIKPKELAYTFFCSVEGALMFSRVARSSEAMEMVVRHCRNILKEIST